MGFYRHNRSLFLVLLGGGLMASSVLWEYVRMKPTYRYLVDPWAMRGWETTQALAICAFGVAIVLLAVPLSVRFLKGKLIESILLMAAATAFVCLVPVFAGVPDQHMYSWPRLWLLAILTALAVTAVVGRVLPSGLARSLRRLILLVVLAGITILGALVVYRPLSGDRTIPVWAVVLLFMFTVDALLLARPPRELIPYRLLLTISLTGLVVALVCSGAVRSTLLRLQMENMGVSAEYRDIQITAGVLWAWAGGVIAFAGAVGLWARRRDELEEHTRAGRQLAVAKLSAAELEQAV